METKLNLRDYYEPSEITSSQERVITKEPIYDFEPIPSPIIRQEIMEYVLHRCETVCIARAYSDRQYFKRVCDFLKEYTKLKSSLKDKNQEQWLRQFKAWMFKERIPLTERGKNPDGSVHLYKSRLIGYFERVLKYVQHTEQLETEKDVWELDKLDIQHKANPIKNYRTVNFKGIFQPEMREEVKKGVYLNLQGEAIACVQKELTAVRRLSRYLQERWPNIQSCRDIDRKLVEEYLTYLKTEATETKHFHADLNRLRALLESIGQVCGYVNLQGLFLTRDIPPTRKAEFKTYSDAELMRLNAEIVKMDEQTARLMIIHQMLGTRISDTLTLETDCLYKKGADIIIRIRQMKTQPYEKPISVELATLIQKAIDYTTERYGETQYVFVDDRNPQKPMQYTTVHSKVIRMIYDKDLRDDHGEHFGFTTHMYRHYYGAKLTEMHLDDWTIAKLLGHSSLRNVKFYRKMSNQMLADDTRRARNKISEFILNNLDGWEDEYEQIRQDGRL